MTHWKHAKRVTITLIYSHLGLMLIWLISVLISEDSDPTHDFLQVVFMASTLTIVSIGAFRYISKRLRLDGSQDNTLIDIDVAKLQMHIIYFFVAALFVVVTLPTTSRIFYGGLNWIELDQIKTAYGVIETILGGYIGIIGKTLFGIPEQEETDDT